MRQAQQNRRGRGRNNNNNNNNNRKNQNPLTRSFESNGPDVKIRGTPSHIAEKYVTMARDALSSGDPVLAENYLQHAEHYNRIIMTHREQQAAQAEVHQQQRQQRQQRDDSEQSTSNEQPDDAVARSESSAPASETVTASGDERRPRRPRRERNPERAERERPDDGEQPPASGRGNGRGRRTRYAQTDEQPEFLKRPVRRPRARDDGAEETAAKSDQTAE